jgi:ribokinase
MPGRVIVVGSVNVDLVMRLPVVPAPGQTVLDAATGHAFVLVDDAGENQIAAALGIGGTS